METNISNNNNNFWRDCMLIIAAWFAAFVFAILASGCKTCNCVTETIEVEKEVKVFQRDTTFITEADSASMVALLECDSNYNVVLNDLSIANGDRLSMAAKLQRMQNGQSQLSVDCNEDSLQHRVEWLEKELSEKKTETIIRVEKEVPAFAKFCIRYFFITLVLGVLCVAMRLYIKFTLGR